MTRPHRFRAAGLILVALALPLVFLTACRGAQAAIPQQRAAAPGGVIVVLVTGMPTEPAPQLTPRAEVLARTVAESMAAKDGPNGPTGLGVVVAAGSSAPVVMELTPRRANGQIEHGLQRASLIDERLAAFKASVGATRSSAGPLDLLDAIDHSTEGYESGTLVIVSNGLSTAGGLDLRKLGWSADPSTIARQLDDRHLLPHLAGWDVLWTGLNETWAPQPALPLPVRVTNRAYWTAICARAAARSCTFDDTSTSAIAPSSAAPATVVPVPSVDSVVGPDGHVTARLPDALLGFGPDSAATSPAAAGTIADLAEQIVTRTRVGSTITVTGYCADPPGSTVAAVLELSQRRASTVAAGLRAAGVSNPIRVVAGGVPPGTTAVRDGQFIESLADQMRRVEVSY